MRYVIATAVILSASLLSAQISSSATAVKSS